MSRRAHELVGAIFGAALAAMFPPPPPAVTVQTIPPLLPWPREPAKFYETAAAPPVADMTIALEQHQDELPELFQSSSGTNPAAR